MMAPRRTRSAALRLGAVTAFLGVHAGMRLRPSILFTLAYGAGLRPASRILGIPSASSCALAAFLWRGKPLVVPLATAVLLRPLRRGSEHGGAKATGASPGFPPLEFRVTVRTLEPADGAGGTMLVQPRHAGCADPVVARWPRGAWRGCRPRGTRHQPVGTTSRALGRPSGILVILQWTDRGGEPSFGARFRNGVAHATSTLYGQRAPIADALVLGRRSGIDPRSPRPVRHNPTLASALDLRFHAD